MARIAKKEYPLTIPQELFDAWVKLRRTNDISTITRLSGLSRPLIDRALKYGYIKNDNLVKIITEFYKKRIDDETEMGKFLLSKAEENE